MNLDVFVTTDCNMQCRFCGAWQQDVPNMYIPTEKAFEILRMGKEYGFKYTTISGGEPLMHPNLVDIVNYADQLGYWINITTNGLLIDDNLLDRLANKKVNIRVSFHTFDREKHIKITGTDSYERVLQSIHLLRDRRMYYSMGSTIYWENIEEVEALADFAFESGAFFVRFTPVLHVFKGSDIKLDEAFHEQLLTKIVKLGIKYKKYLNYSKQAMFAGGDPIDIMTTRRCPAGSNIFMIADASMKLIPCQFVPDGSGHPCFNCDSTSSFEQLKQAMDNLYTDELVTNLEGKCATCAFKAVCFGGCLGNKLTQNLPLTAEQPLCIRDILKNVLKQFDSNDVADLIQYWYYHNNRRTSIHDRNKSCMRKLPIWELNFKYGKKPQDHSY